jgi:DNA mismatch endonuclease (patch repair protein)
MVGGNTDDRCGHGTRRRPLDKGHRPNRKGRKRLSRENRHRMMARFRKTNTGPERSLRKELRVRSVPFVVYPDLPGHPDLLLPRQRTIVLVHGCFWHGCPKHYREPKQNIAYWRQKLERNRQRDLSTISKLRRHRWHVRVVWECDIRSNVAAVATDLVTSGRRDGHSRTRRKT